MTSVLALTSSLRSTRAQEAGADDGDLGSDLGRDDSAGTHRVITPSILYFGTPVVLLSTENQDGTFNLAPNSSVWVLGHTVVIGLGVDGQTAYNLTHRTELVVNLPTPEHWAAVEALGPLTGRFPVPATKRTGTTFVADKFAAAGLTPAPSHEVRPPRVAQCPLQLEARATRLTHNDTGFVIVEAAVARVHAAAELIVEGTQHISPSAWTPLIYNFRHYYGLGHQHGVGYTSETK